VALSYRRLPTSRAPTFTWTTFEIEDGRSRERGRGAGTQWGTPGDVEGSLKIPPYVFLTFAPLFWAGNFVFGRPLSEALPPFGINLIRWLVACAILVPLTLYLEGRFPRPARHLWPGLLVMALAGVLLFNSLVYLSLNYTTSTNAALINGATPILTIVIAAMVGFDRLTGRRVAGALTSLMGVGWIVSQGSLEALSSFSFNRGDLVMLVAALLWAIYTVLVIRVTRVMSPLAVTTITAVLAMPLSLLIGGYELATQPIGEITPVVLLGLVYVGVVASVGAFLFWSIGVKDIGAARASVFLNLIPVFTAVIAAVALDERPGLPQLIGGLLVVCGVTLASSRGRKTADTKPASSEMP
jgi:drug/metabolite transporter (DMT)-like permease